MRARAWSVASCSWVLQEPSSSGRTMVGGHPTIPEVVTYSPICFPLCLPQILYLFYLGFPCNNIYEWLFFSFFCYLPCFLFQEMCKPLTEIPKPLCCCVIPMLFLTLVGFYSWCGMDFLVVFNIYFFKCLFHEYVFIIGMKHLAFLNSNLNIVFFFVSFLA